MPIAVANAGITPVPHELLDKIAIRAIIPI